MFHKQETLVVVIVVLEIAYNTQPITVIAACSSQWLLAMHSRVHDSIYEVDINKQSWLGLVTLFE